MADLDEHPAAVGVTHASSRFDSDAATLIARDAILGTARSPDARLPLRHAGALGKPRQTDLRTEGEVGTEGARVRGLSRWSAAAPTGRPGSPRYRRALPPGIGDVRVVVLVLAGFFDGISDNWLHGLVLWSAACVVGWEARQESAGAASPEQPLLRRSDAGRRSRITGGVLVVSALAFAVTVGSWHRYTWPMTGAIVLVAVAGLATGWRGPLTTPTAEPAADRVGSRLWVGLGIAAGLWELLALSQQPSLTEGSYAHPTVSVLMDSVLASHAGRSLALLAWLALGWFLLEATTVAPRRQSPSRTTEASDELA